MKMSTIDWIAFVLVIVGGLNWGLVAINPSYNVVDAIFGSGSTLSSIIYALVGLSALWRLYSVAFGSKS